MKNTKEDYSTALYQICKPEIYKGIKISNVLDRWMIGLKSFTTLDEAKKWIDKLYPDRKP